MRAARLLPLIALSAGLVLVAFGGTGPAFAKHLRAQDSIGGPDHDAARQGVRSGEIIPYSEVIRIVRSRYPGQILDASLLELVPGEKVYRVLVLTSDGRRLAVWVNARSGNIMRVEG
jgi:uncharacterized membrane protein YkoI